MPDPKNNAQIQPTRENVAALIQVLNQMFEKLHPEISKDERSKAINDVIVQCMKHPKMNFKNLLQNICDKKHLLLLDLLFLTALAQRRGHKVEANLDNIFNFLLMSKEQLELEIKKNPKFITNLMKDVNILKTELRKALPEQAKRLDETVELFEDLIKNDKELQKTIKNSELSKLLDEANDLLWKTISSEWGFDPRGFAFSASSGIVGLTDTGFVNKGASPDVEDDLASEPEREINKGERIHTKEVDTEEEVKDEAIKDMEKKQDMEKHKSPFDLPRLTIPGSKNHS